jgi:hypothetical protein
MTMLIIAIVFLILVGLNARLGGKMLSNPFGIICTVAASAYAINAFIPL